MKVIVFILLITSFNLQAQNIRRNVIAKYSLVFVSGMADGYNQKLYAHYGEFKEKHPNANDQYWNPAISWENKYKDAPNGDFRPAYFGSKTFFVWTTDAYHMTRMVDNISLLSAVAISGLKNESWVFYAVDLVAFFIIRSLGFTLTYNLL